MTEDMASYDSYDAAWVMEEGEYTIRVGNSSRTTEVAAIIDLDETVQTVLLKNVMKDKEFVKRFIIWSQSLTWNWMTHHLCVRY